MGRLGVHLHNEIYFWARPALARLAAKMEIKRQNKGIRHASGQGATSGVG